MTRAICSTSVEPSLGALLDRLKQAGPGLAWSHLPDAAAERLQRLAGASPLYTQLLVQNPAWALWLEAPQNLREEFRFQALLDEWTDFCRQPPLGARGTNTYIGALRRFRRRMSLRIAYREVNEIAPCAVTVGELTRLAEFCVRECWFIAQEQWQRRLGVPWDGEHNRPARFCVLALGKLGGGELNFSSDIDLIYVFDGDGQVRRDAHPTSTTNEEYFHRLGETLTQLLASPEADGFLFRTDLRLRPGGAAGPLVPSLAAMENYYAATAQTWERLALLKARAIAGDLALGDELLESLHSFRYPQHPPAALLAEVAEMKVRTEREIVGADALDRDLKSGDGGIREIEFIAQALQLLHAGRFPFLQTHATIAALQQLVRYALMTPTDAAGLEEAYWFLRRIEHRVQMAEERQTHEVPAGVAERAQLAQSLGFDSLEAFDTRLTHTRAVVREHYDRLFRATAPEAGTAVDPWWPFFADGRVTPAVQARLRLWFGDDKAGQASTQRDLRLFVCGSDTQPLLREQVQRFAALVPALDRVAPRLARPRSTLNRISNFADRYGSRNQFLGACTLNPQFFDVLALLFDRSRFIHELLTTHPGILDEVLRPEMLRQEKDERARQRELAAHTGQPATEHADWLWLYVRAEQVRAAIGQLLGLLDDAMVARDLSALAEAVLRDVLARVPAAEDFLVVAVGKLGGSELTFGSDLDLVLVGDSTAPETHAAAWRALQDMLGPGTGRDATYALDLRLRPHGESGVLAPTMAQMRDYFAGSAQSWERLALTRARVLAGPEDRRRDWAGFVAEHVFGPGLSPAQAADLWRMRLRVQRERDVVHPPERAFKTGAGGLVDIEFCLQILQLRHGRDHPAICTANTAAGWCALVEAGLVEAATAERVVANLGHLQRIEWALRRDQNRAVTVLPGLPEDQRALARWLGAPSWEVFWADHAERMAETRRLVRNVLKASVPSTALETDR